ncbi:unnamed protein product [Ectocarpus sp. 4 AP-2014]
MILATNQAANVHFFSFNFKLEIVGGAFFPYLPTLRLVADTHLDAAADAFVEAYVEKTVRPDWVVTSAPYRHAFAILKQAMPVGRMGVAFKLRLTFLEPTKTRGRWLKENAPDRIVTLPRSTYRGRGCSSTEACFKWETGRGGEEGRKPAICFSLRDGSTCS